MILDPLAPSDRDALANLISRVLVAHASNQGIDLFATTDKETPTLKRKGFIDGSVGDEAEAC
jgi:hypothetical protein